MRYMVMMMALALLTGWSAEGCSDEGEATVAPVVETPTATPEPTPTHAPDAVQYRLSSELTPEEVDAMFTIAEYPDFLGLESEVSRAERATTAAAETGQMQSLEWAESETGGQSPDYHVGSRHFLWWEIVHATGIMVGPHNPTGVEIAIELVKSDSPASP